MRTVVVGATALIVGAVTAVGPAAAEPGKRVAVRADALLTATTADAAADEKLSVAVYLGSRNSEELERFVASVSDPASPDYRNYLTGDQFRARFAPSAQTVAEVRNWLADAGMTVTSVAANSRIVEATGRVAAAERAFGTDLRTSAAGRGPVTPVTVPAVLRGDVIGVSGLASNRPQGKPFIVNDSVEAARTGPATGRAATEPLPATLPGKPCSAYYGQLVDTSKPPAFGQHWPYAVCGYTPTTMRAAYGVDKAHGAGITGAGVRVAITVSYHSPYLKSDVDTYNRKYGLAPFKAGQLRVIEPEDGYYNGENCGEPIWWSEEVMDVEAVHTIAPGADIVVVTAPSCDDREQFEVVNKTVGEHLADIVTNSWGVNDERNNAALHDAYHQTMLEAGAKGIGVYFATGNGGDNTTGTADGKPSTAHPATEPLITAVGGTTLGIGPTGRTLFETGWATGTSQLSNGAWNPSPPGNFTYGTSGGTSFSFPQPSWQAGKVPADIAGRNGGLKRATPDAAMLGDVNTGMLIGQTLTFPDGSFRYGELRDGGTSLAVQLFGAMVALADQRAGYHHGFINPLLYSGAGGSGTVQDISDTTLRAVVRSTYVNGVDDGDGIATSLRTMKYPQVIGVRTGWDDMTGVGTVRWPGVHTR